MPSQPPIPPLLSPYTSNQPSSSLILLTSTLGATANWLVLRFIHDALKKPVYIHGTEEASISETEGNESRVVLVSWLRDANFWKEGARKLGTNFKQMHLVDCLERGLGVSSGGLADIEVEILRSIESAKESMEGEGRVLLVLDGLDFLLAATGCPVMSILDMIGELREHVDSTIITSCADIALTQSSTTPLEMSHAAFAMSMAHQAMMILSVKGLDTGFAKDVSGVLRVSRGAAWDSMCEAIDDKELLYFIESDSGAKVFERGA